MHVFFRRSLAALVFLLLPLAAHAATLNVPAQYATIQAGVNAAANGDTVLVADGTYTGTGNRDIDFMGKNITVTSVNGPTKTIIDCAGSASADGSGSHRGFYLHSSETDAVIDGFTVKNGYTQYVQNVSGSGSGGGIYVASYHVNTILVTDCTVTGNTASSGNNRHAGQSGSGGGIFVDNYGNAATGSILVTNCIVTHCTVVDNDPTNEVRLSGSGGGVCALDYGAGSISITDCSVTGNTAERGAGIYTYINTSVYLYPGPCTISLTHCTVNGNTASDSGGGIFNFNLSDSNSLILMNDCTVNNNKALSGTGGGIDNENEALTFTRVVGCTVDGNTAGDSGGGIYNDNNSDTPYFEDGYHTFPYASLVQVIGCAVSGNTALSDGGGVYNYVYNQGLVQMVNCTVSGNTASDSGGGLYNENHSTSTYDDDDIFYPSGGISVTACTVTANTAAHGGGMENATQYIDAVANVTDCIVTNNLHGEVSNVAAADVAKNVAVDHSDVQGGHSGTGNLDVDPLFVNAASGDFHLQQGSPVLGKGITVKDVTTDKDGVFRANPPSMGAYEYPFTATFRGLSPSTKPAGSKAFTLTVSGTGFPSNSVVHWNNTVLPTTFVSSTTLTAFVSASLLHRAAIVPITVTVYGAASPAIPFTVTPVHIGVATAIASGPDGKTRVLWNRADGAATVWTLNTDGSVADYGTTYGPRAGWTAKGISVAPDNAAHLLWTKTDGSATLWKLPVRGAAPTYGLVYGPYAGWVAVGVTTASYGASCLLWTSTSGQATVWRLDASDSVTSYGEVYGPYAGWAAQSVALSSSGYAHLLWDNTDGSSTLWTVAGYGVTDYGTTFGPVAGWTAKAVAAGPDGSTRILWNKTDGSAVVWTLNASGTVTSYGTIYGSYAGQSAVSLSVDTSNLTHLLWVNTDGHAAVWTLNAAGSTTSHGLSYGPY